MNFNVKSLPPSYAQCEVKAKLGLNEIAYCYSGGVCKDAIMFRSTDGSLLMFYAEHDKDVVYDPYEIWAFLSEIPNGTIRQNAVNRWFEVFNTFDGYLNLESYAFNI